MNWPRIDSAEKWTGQPEFSSKVAGASCVRALAGALPYALEG